MDVQPEGPVQVVLASDESHQLGWSVMRGLKHGLLAQGVSQQRTGMQPGHDAVTHGDIWMQLNQPNQALGGLDRVMPDPALGHRQCVALDEGFEGVVDRQVQQDVGVGLSAAHSLSPLLFVLAMRRLNPRPEDRGLGMSFA